MDIYIKGHKGLTVASELTPTDTMQYSTFCDIAHSYTAYGGYLGYTYIDSYSYHLTVGNRSYTGYTYVPIKLSYNKSYLSYENRTISSDYDVYLYDLEEDSGSGGGAADEGGDSGVQENEVVQDTPEEPTPVVDNDTKYRLLSTVSTRTVSFDVQIPQVTDQTISYEYNSYTAYSYSYAYLASYSYFHHDWTAYSYSYSYNAYSYDSYMTMTTLTDWNTSLSRNEISFNPYEYNGAGVSWSETARE